MTGSMKRALKETDRRRKIQIEYNKKNNITPQTIVKEIKDIREGLRDAEAKDLKHITEFVPKTEVPALISTLEEDMHTAAVALDFERAAKVRDQIKEIKKAFGLS
jgi:excinuclease ABC subunit B